MAKRPPQAKKKQPVRSSLLTRLLLLLLLAGIGWQLYTIRGQVIDAAAERDLLAAQVAEKQQENDALAADIAQGGTQEKMEELARDELGMVTQDEYVFYDVN